MAYRSVINITKDRKKREEVHNKVKNARTPYVSTGGAQSQATATTSRPTTTRTSSGTSMRERVANNHKGQSYYIGRGFQDRGETKTYTYHVDEEWKRMQEEAERGREEAYYSKVRDNPNYANTTKGREEKANIKQNNRPKYNVTVGKYNTEEDEQKKSSLQKDSSLNRYRGALEYTRRTAEKNSDDLNKWSESVGNIQPSSQEEYSSSVAKGRNNNPLRKRNYGLDESTLEYFDYLYGSGRRKEATEGVSLIQKSNKLSQNYKTQADEYENAALKSNQNIANNFNNEAKSIQQRIDDISSGKIKVSDPAGEISALNEKRAEYEAAGREYQGYADTNKYVTTNQVKMSKDPDVEAKIEAGKQKDTFLYTKDNADAYRVASSMGGLDDLETLRTAAMTMTEAELRQYYYTLAEDDEEAAINYLRTLYNDTRDAEGNPTGGLGQRFAEKFNEVRDKMSGQSTGFATLNKVFDYSHTFGAGATNAVVGLKDAGERLFASQIIGDNDVHLEGITQKIYQNNVQSGRVNKIAGDIVYNVGNMMPQIAVSIATGGVGAAPMVATLASSATVGLSSFGNTYQQARREGFDSTSATIYGVLNGVSEAGLQAALSGIAAKGFGVVTEDIVRNATDALKRTALSPVTKSILGTIITQSIDASGEFVEEYLQEILDPVFRNWALGEANEFQPFTSEALYAGFLGALSAGVMNSVSVANGYAQYVSEGKMQRIAVPELVEQGLSFAKTSEAYKSSEYFQNKLNNGEELTDLEVGLLAQQTEEQLAVENEINGYKYGDINWNTLSDQTRATLVNPENAAYLAEQFGFDVNENMSPDEMRAAIEQNAQESYAKENRRSFDDLVQEQLNNTESQEDIDKINKTAEQNREIYTDAEQATGKEIVIADLDKGVNGFATADRIVLSSEIANTDEGARFVLAHEITHGTELSRHWSALLDSAKKFFGENWDTEVQRIQQLYSRDNPNFSIEQAEREVVADFVGKHVFTDIESMKNFIRDHKTTARRIMSWLKSKFTNTSGTNNTVLREAYNNFERAFNEIDRSMEGKRAAVQYQSKLAGESQYSINRDQIIRNQKRAESASEENRYVNENDEEDFINTGKDPSTRHKKARDTKRLGSLLLKSKEEAADFIDRAIKDDQMNIVRPFGLVGKKTAQDVAEYQHVNGDMGVDVSGYYLEINSSDLSHAYKEHLNAKEKGDIPLSLEDFENIPEYLNTYDDILAIYKRGDAIRIQFGKKINGYSIIITTVSTNRHSLTFKNMIGVDTSKYMNIKKSKPLRMEADMASNNAPHPNYPPAYSEGSTSASSDSNIDQDETVVNTGRQNSLSPIEESAIENFGTTDSWDETGYITTDGSQLDFSGRHWGNRENGVRTVEHNDISEVNGLEGSDAMYAFMNDGAVRIAPETGGIELITEPTEAQLRQIANYARQNRGDVMLDVSDEDGRTIFSKDYAVGTNPSAVVSDIRNYFDNNAQPEDALFSRAQVAQETKQELASQDLDYDEATQSVSARQYSASSFTTSDYVTKKTEMARRMSETLSGVTQEQAEKWIDDVTGIANVIFGDQGRLDYATEYEGFSALRDNAEYDKTVDFSLICAKRRLYTGTMNLIRSMMPDAVLLGEDLARIRELMVAKGDEVACGTCYVETSRLQQDVYTSRFIEAYKESQRTGKPIQYTNSSGKQTELVSTKETGRKSFVADPMLNVTMESFLSTDSMNRIRNNYPDLALAYDTYMNRLGTAKPKAVETRIAYRHEILDDFKTAKRIERFNKTGGLRVNSFSDFETPHLIDMMQVVLDMASVGLKSHAYTKVPNFAWVFGDTGVKINCSLFGKGTGLDSNGNLVFDDVEGMPHEEAFKLRDNYSKNVGTILVGMNEAHIRAALADPRIDMVIPYHKSQMTDALAARFGLDNYQDYTSSQNEIDLKTGKKVNHNINVIFGETSTTLAEDEMVWDFSKSELENTQAYLDLCEELGRKPKFAEFLDKQGDKYIATKGYYKMLVDFKVYDNEGNVAPHEVVTPNFNMDEANRVLDEYEGGADNLPVDREVAEQFVAEFQQNKAGQTINSGRQYAKDYVTGEEIETLSRKIGKDAFVAAGLDIIAKRMKGEFPLDVNFEENIHKSTKTVSNTPVAAGNSKLLTNESFFTGGERVFKTAYGSDNINTTNSDIGNVRLNSDMVRETLSKYKGFAERKMLLDLIPHLKELLENGKVLSVEQVLHTKAKTKNKKGALFVSRVFNTFMYNGKQHIISCEVVKNIKDNVGYMYRDIKIASRTTGNAAMAARGVPTNATINNISELYDAVKQIPRKNGGLLYTAAQAQDLAIDHGYNRGSRQWSVSEDTSDSRTILENAQEAYGKKPAGENPVREHNVPNRTSENRFVSNYARTLYEAEATTDEMIPALDSGIAAEDFSYERISNAKLQKGADVILQNDGIESARKQWDGVAERSDAATPQDIALGQTLYNEYVKAGDYDNAIQVAMDLARKATTAGQTVQAFRLLKKLTPDGQLYTLEKLANDYNKQLAKRKIKGFKGIEIDENLAKQLLEAKTKTDIQAAREAIMQNIADQVPATWADKLNAWRYMSMLFNPRTHIRNIVGNAFFVPMRGFKDLIGAGMERAVQKAGGMTQEQRTKTVVNPFDKSNKQYFDKAREAFDENVDIIRGEDKYGKSQIDQQRRIFKSRVLNWIDKFNSAMLEKEDVIFMKKAFVDSYAKAMKARGITAETMTAAQENEITDYAIREAQKATYRDANALATALNKFKQSNKFAHLIGEGLFPFTKTPLNILKRGIEYSPLGIIKGTYQALNGVRKGTTTAAEAIDSMASGISGTSILALGAWLASQGLIKGGSDDDNESALDSLQGGQSYSLVIGDKSYTLDWAAPVAMPLFIGVEMFNSFDKDNEGGANFSRIVDSITKISDPLFNLSMLSSLNSAIDTIKYNEGASALTEIGINVLTSYAGQYVPTISGQFARIIDENQRKTFYAKDSNLPKAIDSLWQGAVKKIPGLSMIMQPSIDRWGKEKKTENVTERVLENLVSPGYYSERSSDDVDREIDRLYVQIGDASVIPPTAEKSIKWTNFETKETGEMNLTAEQYTKYSKRLGSLAYEGVQDLIKSDAYKQLNDRERADAINEIYDYAKNIAKNEITGGKYQLKDWAQVLKDNNDVLGDYAIYKTKISGKDMGTKEKREMLQEMKMPDEVREQIYRASFSESDVEKLDEAEKKGARFNQFLSMKIAMDKIDESDSDSKNTDKKKWLINNISSEKSLTALWETFFETDSTAERNTLSYAKSQGVSVDSFMRREVQKTTEEADYSDATKQDYLYQIVNGEAQIVTDEKGVAVYGSKMKKALDHMLHSGYNEDELNYFYQREYGSDDTFVWARQAGMEARTYIEARDSTLMLSADKDENGKSISGTKKAKVADALNALATSRINKLIMFGKSYTLTTSQYQDIIDYVFDLSNLSNEEKLQVLEGLKIEVIDGVAYPRKAS